MSRGARAFVQVLLFVVLLIDATVGLALVVVGLAGLALDVSMEPRTLLLIGAGAALLVLTGGLHPYLSDRGAPPAGWRRGALAAAFGLAALPPAVLQTQALEDQDLLRTIGPHLLDPTVSAPAAAAIVVAGAAWLALGGPDDADPPADPPAGGERRSEPLS